MGPVMTDVLALLVRGAFLKAPFKLDFEGLPPHHALQGRDLRFVLLQEIGGAELVLEGTGFVLGSQFWPRPAARPLHIKDLAREDSQNSGQIREVGLGSARDIWPCYGQG
jgi:hypothetical protein